jgi:hypothetical protein
MQDIRKFFAPKTGGGSTAAKPSGEAHKPAGDEAASPAVPAAAAAPAAPGDEQGAGSSKATNRTPSRGKGSKKSPAKPEPASKSAAAPAAAKPKAPSKSPEGRGAPAAKPKATSKSAGAKSAAASIPAKRKKSEATSKTGGGQGNDSDWSDEVDLAQQVGAHWTCQALPARPSTRAAALLTAQASDDKCMPCITSLPQSSDADDFEIDLASESEEEESRQAAKAKKKGPRKEQEPAAKVGGCFEGVPCCTSGQPSGSLAATRVCPRLLCSVPSPHPRPPARSLLLALSCRRHCSALQASSCGT